MKRLGRLVSWHWHLVRRPFMLLCGVYGAQQMALLLLSAARKETLGMQMADLFMGCGQLPLFFVTLYLVLLTAASATCSGGRSHMMYTLHTMPFPRLLFPAAQILLSLLLQIIFTAWQVVLYMVFYFPVTALSGRVAVGLVSGTLPAGSLFEEINANPLFQMLLPVRGGSWIWVIGFMLLLSIQSACIACCRGFRRAAAMFLAMATAGVGAGSLYLRYYIETNKAWESGVNLLLLLILGAAVLPALLNLGSALWALYRAEKL